MTNEPMMGFTTTKGARYDFWENLEKRTNGKVLLSHLKQEDRSSYQGTFDNGLRNYVVSKNNRGGWTIFENSPKKENGKKDSYFNSEEFKAEREQTRKDIKEAQIENKKRHVEYMKKMDMLIKIIALQIAENSGRDPNEIQNQIGFEEYRENQEMDRSSDV